MSFKIIGTGMGVPQKIVTNDDLSLFLETNDEWICSRTGIKQRRICVEETLTDLSATAAKQAIDNAGIDPSEIDMIIATTVGGDYVFPSLSCMVRDKLGICCSAFDLNAACAGFLYALEVAAMYFETNRVRKILIVSAEMMSKRVDWQDRATCVLFGDGAGACVLTKGTALKYIHCSSSGEPLCINLPDPGSKCPYREDKDPNAHMIMKGQEVFKFAVSTIEKEAAVAFEVLGITASDIHLYLLHQANKRIIDSARVRLNQPEEKFPYNINKYGNISSASVPILLHEMLDEGRIKPGDKLFLCAFGSGLTYGTGIIEWE